MINKIEVEKTENGYIFRVKGRTLVSGMANNATASVFAKCLEILDEENKEPKKIEIKKE